jgi:hypothetical protein
LGAASRFKASRVVLSFAWVCCASAWPSSALADDSRYRLQVVRAEGAGSCPAASAIESDVSQRLGRSPFSETGERGIEVVLTRLETRWQAKLYLRVDPNAGDSARVLESDAETCADLGKSVTLAVALAIAPDLPPLPKPEPEPEPECPPAPSIVAPPPLPRASLHGEASLRALVAPHLLPNTSFGTAISVSVRGELFGAAFGGIFYPEGEVESAGARLGFGISAGFASGCLWARVQDPQVWSCIGARVGALHSVVYSPRPAQPGDRFWWAASSELGIRQHLVDRLFVELGAAAVFPLVRHRFVVDSGSTPAYEQGPAMVEGFAGFGLRLD